MCFWQLFRVLGPSTDLLGGIQASRTFGADLVTFPSTVAIISDQAVPVPLVGLGVSWSQGVDIAFIVSVRI